MRSAEPHCAHSSYAPAFPGLSTLKFTAAKVVDFPEVNLVPFRLKSLTLAGNVDAPYFLQSVIAPSRLQEIVGFVTNGSDDFQTLMSVLPEHSSQLRVVQVGFGSWRPEVFTTFRSLQKLSFFGYPKTNNFESILSNITTPLYVLQIIDINGGLDEDHRRQLLEIILEYLAKPVFGSLKFLRLSKGVKDSTSLVETGLTRECDSRGIEVVWRPLRSKA